MSALLRPILIIDGTNLFLRSFTAVPTMNTNGDHIGGLLGSLRSLKAMIRELDPSDVIVVWDGAGGSAKRRSMFSEYKAGRKPRMNREYDFETPDESLKSMRFQFGKTKDYLEAFGISQIEIESIEADDVIAFLCRSELYDENKIIVSSDKDFFQLVDGKTLLFSPSKDVYYGLPETKERFGLLPENYILMKSLIGDGSDNISGIKGIGEKTVLKLFPFLAERHCDLDELIEYARANQASNKRYKTIVEESEKLHDNFKLMQLSAPVITPQSVRAIRYAAEHAMEQQNMTEIKIMLLRDGVQITDSDFFTVFRNYSMRRKVKNVRE